MNVVQITERFCPYIGGVESHVLNLSRALRREGVDSVVVTRRTRLPMSDSAENDRFVRGVNVVAVGSILSLSANLRRLGPALVHLHGARSRLAIEAGFLCIGLGIPFVITPHCFYPSRGGWDSIRKGVFDSSILPILLRRARHIICLTDVDRMDAEARGALVGQIHEIPNAVDLEDILEDRGSPPPDGWDLNRRFVLSVGRLDRIKGFDLLIRAFCAAAPEDCTLLIVGPDGGDASRLHALVEECRGMGRVLLTGAVPDQQLRWMYRNSKIFVLASTFEGLPTVVLEAMAVGLPVLASDAGGTARLIHHGVNGFLFRAGDQNDLASQLRLLLRAKIRVEVSETARREVAQRYSWQVNGGLIREIYRRCLDGTLPSPS